MTDQKLQHTPGPWLKSNCMVLSNDEDRGMRFAIAERVLGRNLEDQEANGRLIAAAPELLACLLAYVELEEQAAPYSSSPMREKARAAIAKAV